MFLHCRRNLHHTHAHMCECTHNTQNLKTHTLKGIEFIIVGKVQKQDWEIFDHIESAVREQRADRK